jgi:alpha-N-arabinofuranosidase
VPSRCKTKYRHYLCFDEWNVWYRKCSAEHTNGSGKFAPHLIEEQYNLEDALVVAGFLNSFIRHADVVKIANLAQIVNVIAPIQTHGDDMLLQTIFYPFAMYSSRRDGIALLPSISGPAYESPSFGRVNIIDISAILGDGVLHSFLVNRNISETAEIEIDHGRGKLISVISSEVVSGSDPNVCNTYENPKTICSQPLQTVKISEGKGSVQLPPLSVAAITFRTA